MRSTVTRKRSLYWFAYGSPPSVLNRGRGAKDGSLALLEDSLHMLRDGQAFAELHALLGPTFEFKDCILNLPHRAYGFGEPARLAIEDIEPNSVLVVTTRPPLDDEGGRRVIERSGTALEATLLNAVRPVFAICSRSLVTLNTAIACEAAPPDWTSVEAKGYGAAPAVGYLVSVRIPDSRNVWALWAFAMDGTKTFIWAHLLRTQLAAEVARLVDPPASRILIAAMSGLRLSRPGAMPATLQDAARGCEAKVVWNAPVV